MNSLLFANVADPTDFPENSSAPGLRSLDASLRCTICGELYDAPVTLLCGHCFCSCCLRTSLAEKQECPACRKAANDGHLRPNPAVEEAVAAWKQSRPYVLKLAKDDEQRRTYTISSPETPKHKRRRIDHETPRSYVMKSRTSSGNSAAGSTPLRPKRSREPSSEDFDTIPSSDIDEQEVTLNPQPEDLVSCPLCGKKVKHKNINQHIDKGCKDPEPIRSAPADWKRLMGGSKKGKQKEGTSDEEDEYRLPKASYGTLKDKQLKEMLSEQNLPTTGDRNTLIQRHQRWVMIYNSNLDRSKVHRRPKSELRKELKKWEEEKAKRKKVVVEDAVVHEKRHKDEFAKLVAAARGNKKPPSKAATTEHSESQINHETSEAGERARSRTKSSTPQARPEDVIVVDSEEERQGGYL